MSLFSDKKVSKNNGVFIWLWWFSAKICLCLALHSYIFNNQCKYYKSLKTENCSQLSEVIRGNIIELHQTRIGFLEIASQMKRNNANIIRSWVPSEKRLWTTQNDDRVSKEAIKISHFERHNTSRSIGDFFGNDRAYNTVRISPNSLLRVYSYQPRLI